MVDREILKKKLNKNAIKIYEYIINALNINSLQFELNAINEPSRHDYM